MGPRSCRSLSPTCCRAGIPPPQSHFPLTGEFARSSEDRLFVVLVALNLVILGGYPVEGRSMRWTHGLPDVVANVDEMKASGYFADFWKREERAGGSNGGRRHPARRWTDALGMENTVGRAGHSEAPGAMTAVNIFEFGAVVV